MRYRWVLVVVVSLFLVSLVTALASTSGNITWKIEKGTVVVDYILDQFSFDAKGNPTDGTLISIYRRGFDKLYGYYDISEVEWQTTGTKGTFVWVIPRTGISKALETYYYAKIYRGNAENEERTALVNSDTRKTMADVLSVSASSLQFVQKGVVPTEATR